MNDKMEYTKLLIELTKLQLMYFEADSGDKLYKSQNDFIKKNIMVIGEKMQEIEKELGLS